MGAFTDKFKLNQRLQNSDFGRSETLAHWKLWAEEVLKRNGYVDRVEDAQEVQDATEAQDIFNELANENGEVVDSVQENDVFTKHEQE